jgi:hypothetical protein
MLIVIEPLRGDCRIVGGQGEISCADITLRSDYVFGNYFAENGIGSVDKIFFSERLKFILVKGRLNSTAC